VRLHIFSRQRAAVDEGLQPPGAATLGTGFRTADQVAFADDANHLALLIDDRHAADAPIEQGLGDLHHEIGHLRRDHRRGHYITCLHGFLPSRFRLQDVLRETLPRIGAEQMLRANSDSLADKPDRAACAEKSIIAGTHVYYPRLAFSVRGPHGQTLGIIDR